MQAGRKVFLRADSVVGRAASRAEAEARVNHEATVAEARARAAYALQRASEYLDAPNLGQIRNELYGAAQALSVAAGRAGDATAQDDADRLRRMADAAGTGLGRPHVAYLASLYHYGWRTCGSTAWR
jgi:cob(I)alamin adenosyltransferase